MSLRRLKEIERGALAGKNHLQRALISATGAKGFYRTGSSLAGGAHLINTLRSATAGFENDDRYKRSFVQPEVKANIAVTLDCSGSMSCYVGRDRAKTLISECILASWALGALCKRMKVGFNASLCLLAREEGYAHSGYSGNLVPLWEGGSPTRPLQTHLRFNPNDGTHVASYARSALRLVEQMPRADHNIAVYMTDGSCNSTHLLQSLSRMAKARNIHLVGVVMGGISGQGHPCALECSDGADFANKGGKHLAGVVTGRVKQVY